MPGDNRWESASWELGLKTEPFYFTLKLENETGENCSVAVDNITMRDCFPDYLPAYHYCTFDENSTCGWHSGPYTNQSKLTWLMNRGPTPSKNTGPWADHTSQTDKGYYMYIEADTEVPKGRNPHAQLDSRLFLPPPLDSQNHSGGTVGPYGLCQVTFAYHKYGFDAYKLSLSAVFPCSDKQPKVLWVDNMYMWKNNVWKMQRVNLTEINEPFRLRFTAVKSLNDGHLADFALDDIALSPACFGRVISATRRYYADYHQFLTNQDLAGNLKEQCRLLNDMLNHTYKFNNCGAQGFRGPTESMCNMLYTYSLNKVKVTNGIQTWTVSQAGQYSITALGASGGSGAKSVGESNGAYVHGKFNLSKGQKIHILVGQKGWNSCSQIGFGDVNEICKGEESSENATYLAISGGGGGGGGATYVFLGELGTDDLTPLLIAGGGGGLGYNMTKPDSMVMGGWDPDHGSGESGYSYPSGAGGGGGWYGHADGLLPQAGKGVLYSAHPGQGGVACPAAKQQGWYSSGGFGGGGGGCFTGGGGGGYTGGNSSHENNVLGFINGRGGTSYIDPKAVDAAMERGI
ncbi:tyrosine-protein kinase receptor-like [Liolophura sinensis]|uniref:tyrosine-protein kinase receptor-like n=1 Tax=Liolophura sinensis TaxID=3198878 RepID=UPI0031586ACB